MSLRVSVAMATYNGERFIREQLDSILSQTRLPSEIVICDDGSTDGTVALIREVLSQEVCESLRIAVIVRQNTENLGPGENFRQAISMCSSEVIALADQDDVWLPEKLDELVGILERDDSLLLVHSDARLIDALGDDLPLSLSQGLGMSAGEKQTLQSGHTLPALMRRNLVTGATAVFRAELRDLAFKTPTIDLHDGRLAIVASLLDSLVFTTKELVLYRQHESNQIGGKPLSALDTVVALLKSWLELTDVLRQRNRELEDLLEQLGNRVSSRNRGIVRSRVLHNEWRIGLPSSRLLRVWPVLWGSMRGRYRRWGRFPHDATRDLLMPPREILLGIIRRFSRKFL